MNLKIFGKNAIVYSVGTVVLRASSFLLIPLYTHYLSLSDYGLLSTLLLTIQILVTIVDFGIRSGMMRFMAKYEQENRLKEFLGSALAVNIMGGLLTTLVTIYLFSPILRVVLHSGDISNYIMLTCLTAVVQSLCINIISYYRAKNQGLVFMIINLAASLLLIAGSLLFLVKLNMGIQGILISQIMSYGIIWAVVTAAVSLKHGLSVSPKLFLLLLKFGFPLIFAMAGNLLMNTSAVYFLGYFTNLEQVAIYSLAFKIASIAEMVVILPFQMAYEPFVFANLHNPEIKATISKLTTYLLLTFTVVGFLIVFVFRGLIHLIAPPEYSDAYIFIFLLLPGIAAQGLQYVGQSLLHVQNKTHVTGIIVFSLSLFSVALNYIFIRQYGIWGLVAVFNIIMFTIAVMLLVQGSRTFTLRLELRRVIMVSLAFIILLVNAFTFRNVPAYFYYPVALIVLLSTGLTLYWGKFLKKNEKAFLSGLFKKKNNRAIEKQLTGENL
ncbi:MAG: lipopolysaccharide biosynthesis protein [Bacteroidota bacterium]|nr:polysaccharide biosynthesis protein [Ignavibacteria bacterium]MCU7498038.1 polysaccharide biosynthesis protein [Ignavibacteria bacterium]MCU7512138.1 polysaccharide biosynthesis protein [Ignavibacteria bacterium]MCU7520443.1 polysaccharide biosynthesis protein [Ignavibacteria bacterium]MCU7523876.1 polysaccharide biosynthesis protein [Ignavibacteria bacterium]